MVRWGSYRLVAEEHVKEVVKDVKFLHNGQYFAAAQRKYAYIYDKRGIEIHCLKDHVTPNALEFLPHHFLLCSIGEQGVLRYQDVTHGALVAQHRTKLGACEVMRYNPQNAIVHCGHGNGTVTLWSPNAGHAQSEDAVPPRADQARILFFTPVPVRPRSRGARRSLKSFSPVDRLSPSITPRF